MPRPWTLADLPAEQAAIFDLDAQATSKITFDSGNDVNTWFDSVQNIGVISNNSFYYDSPSSGSSYPGMYTFAGGIRPIPGLVYPTGSDPIWIAVVTRAAANKSNPRDIVYVGDPATGTARLGVNASNYVYLRTKSGSDLVTPFVIGDGYHCLVAQFGAGGQSVDLDGGSQVVTSALPEARTAGVAGIGGSGDWESWHQRLIIGRGVLSADNRARVQSFIMWGNGIQAKMPASQPYKAAAPTVGGGPTLTAGAGAIAISGKAAALLHGFTMPADGAAMALAGRAIALRNGRRLPADAGSVALAGLPIEMRRSRVLSAAVGGLTLTGQSSQAIYARRLGADLGTFRLVGTEASFTKVGRRSLMAETAALNIAGPSVSLATRRRLVADLGQLTITGQAMYLRRQLRLRADPAVIGIAGATVSLRLARRIAAGPGILVLTPQTATLTITSTPTPIVIPPYNCFAAPGRQRFFTVPARQRAFVIRRGTSMQTINKHPAAERQYEADWSLDLNGQMIVGEITATSSDPTLIVDRVKHDGRIMTFWLRGGTTRGVASVQFIAPTSGEEDLDWTVVVVS